MFTKTLAEFKKYVSFSFRYLLFNNGPRIEPGVTPHFIYSLFAELISKTMTSFSFSGKIPCFRKRLKTYFRGLVRLVKLFFTTQKLIPSYLRLLFIINKKVLY